MRPFSERTHYEVLEIDPDAAPEEVERAYRLALATYGGESMAVYSLYSEEETRAARERVELAYEVLSDAAARQHYDASLHGAAGEPWAGELDASEATDDLLLPPPLPLAPPGPPPPRAEVMAAIEGFEDVDDEGDGGVYDGARLRRARLLRGVEIDQIATVTKINPTYLHFIEEERFDDLPATVYVRGFVTAYARCLGLDASGATLSYVERIQQHRGEGQRLRSRA